MKFDCTLFSEEWMDGNWGLLLNSRSSESPKEIPRIPRRRNDRHVNFVTALSFELPSQRAARDDV